MRQLIVFILLLSVLCKTNAQNFRTIKAGSEAYFANPEGFVRAIRIDSIKANGTDTLLYNFNNIITVDDLCFRIDLGSWIGRPVLIRESGDTYYFNYYNDSIMIRTHAGLNDSWICYRWPDKRKIAAKVTEIEEETFLDLTDSVKTIELQVTDSMGNGVVHELNGFQMKLSCHFGFVSMPAFMVFPDYGDEYYNLHHPDLGPFDLAGLTNPETGVTNLTWKKIYDYESGDEIHTSTFEYSCNFTNPCGTETDKKEIFRVLSREEKNDTILYSVELRVQNFGVNGLDTIDYFITDYPKFDLLPGEIVGDFDLNEFTMGTKSKSEPYIFDAVFGDVYDSCKYQLAVDACDVTYTYYKGLGGPYYDAFLCPFTPFYRYSHKLLYYRKGEVTWGTPLIISDVHDFSDAQFVFSIFPNPAKDLITVNIPETWINPQLEIWNLCGQKITGQNLKGQSVQVDISSVSDGIYFISIIGEQGKYIAKLVVK